MTRKILLFTLTYLLCCEPLAGQHRTSRGQVQIVFDSEGKIIAFPPAVLKQRKEVAFKVKVPLAYLSKQKNQFLKYLQQTQRTLDGTVNTIYTCLLGTAYTNYKTDLDHIVNAMEAKDFMTSQQQLTAPALNANKHIPAGDLVRRMLDSQFQVKVYNGATLLVTIALKREYGTGDYVYFSAGKTFRGLDYKEQLEENTTAVNEYKFVLQRHDPLNETVVKWYKASLEGIQQIDPEQIRSGLDHIGDPSAGVFNTNLRKLQQLNEWFANWLWYTKGVLTLNPFAVPTEDALAALADKIEEKTIHLAQLKERQQFIDSCIAQLRAREYNLDALTRLQADAETVRLGIKNDSAKLGDLRDAYAASTALQAKIATVPQLYSGMLYTSTLGNITVMKRFDAAVKYRLVYKNAHTFIVNKWSKERVTEVPENEKVMLMVENTPTDVKLSIDEKRQDFDDLEAFTKLATDLLAKADFTSTLSATSVSKLEAFTGSLASKGGAGAVFGGPIGGKHADCTVGNLAQDMLVLLAAKADGFALPYDLEPVDLKEAATPAYSAYVQQAALDKYEAPFRDSISIQDVTRPSATKDVAKSFLKIGALRHAQIAAGIAIARKPVSTNTIDTSGNGLRVSASDNASNVIVGFKLYPLKTYNRDNSIIPRYPLRRLSAFGGFDMLHPLNNFYLGGSYDIVPGLAFTVGNNYYKQTAYTVASNKVTDTKTRYASGGTFYAVTVNPILFVQIIKTFFK